MAYTIGPIQAWTRDDTTPTSAEGGYAGAASTAAVVGMSLDQSGKALGTVDNLTITATTLDYGQPATATINGVAPYRTINVGIPKGMTDDVGQQLLTATQNAEASAATSAAQTAQSLTLTQQAQAASLEVPDTNVSALIGNPATDTAAAFARKVPSVSVLDHGAVGDGVTDDTGAINAAATYAATKGRHTRLLFPAVDSAGYRTTAAVNIPGAVDVEMESPIVREGSGAALIVGETGPARHVRARHTIRVRRNVLSSWLSEGDVGVRLINQYWCHINLMESTNFTIGAQFVGTASQGFAYNQITVGTILDCRIGLDLDANTGGWVNENTVWGGSHNVSSNTHTTTDRTGIRITSSDGSYYSNSNVFYRPSFEIKGEGETFTGLCVDAVYSGLGNRVLEARHESPSSLSVITRNNSVGVEFTTSYDSRSNPPTMQELGTFTGTIIRSGSRRIVDSAQRLIFKADGLHRKACIYNTSGWANIPGVVFQTSGASVVEREFASGVSIASRHVEIPTTAMIGVYLSTRTLKRFTIATDADPGFGGRMVVRCHAVGGAVISTAGAVRSNRAAPSFLTWYGGAFRTGVDANDPWHFTVSGDVDYVFVGIAGGDAPARLRSFSLFALDNETAPATWLPWVDDGLNRGTAAPTTGTWERGRRILHATPTPGQPQGWVCTTAGTPGTWTAMPNL